MFIPAILRGQDNGPYIVANQYPLYSQYLMDGLVINPAYAGSRDALSMSLLVRKRMLGFAGESSMQSFTAHAPMKKERIALGVSVNHLTYGITTQNSFFGYYAFQIRGNSGLWSLGIKGGVDMTTSDYSGIVTVQPGDPAFSTATESSILPNVGAGIYYSNKKFFAGLAVPALLTYKSDTLSSGYIMSPDMNYYDLIFSAGALISFSESLRFKPSVLVKYSMNNSLRIDLNGNFIIADFIWIGASWRVGEQALVGIIEAQLTQSLKLGYSYDYNMSEISSFVGGTHEIGLRLEFGKKVNAANPRYF